ncbi:M23 family metallopeptidase [Niabella yanshanensis]|uniref:M23 family metallopeptidase n=1 Tax=Niabella yanshanensis TaxID=577386 RepID=A0ABZ0VZT1_9BACT|nr:M23 family metallopeptidase [Niabella yanshanensis]WQD36331.1 M23 family metallopeptidase [Niabella yanshanensis]
MKRWTFYVLLIFLIPACKQIRPLLQNTVRGKYESGFSKKDSLFKVWKASHERAMATPLQVDIPYIASIQIKHADASALVYTVSVKRGEQLIAEIKKPADSSRFILEFFNGDPAASKTLLAELAEKAGSAYWTAQDDDSVRISLQPGVNDSGIFHFKIYKQPSYQFPVAGKNNTAIQSFWGANRDGGARLHEGIDIFAPRGTPIAAVADGRIGFAGDRGLGGKQVWLRENLAGFNVYYAHLDSFIVNSGDAVKRGDTLGFVGNTGNAAGGAPHLHFGIYGNDGAVDPLAFIKELPVPADRAFTIDPQAKLSRSGPLRKGPGTKYPPLMQLNKNEPLKFQARSDNWLHVTVRDSVAGFVPK